MKARAYLAFAATGFQSQLAYRGRVWASWFGELVQVLARIAIWTAAFGGASVVDGITLPEMVTYAILAGLVLNVDFSDLLTEVGAAVKTGDVAVYLLKPMHYPLYLLTRQTGLLAFEMLAVIAPVTIIIALAFGMLPPASLFHGAMFLLYWVLSFLIVFTLATLCGLLAFWLLTAFALEWFLIGIMALFSGSLVPLWFFPAPLAAVTANLPFAWVAFYPSAVYLGKLDIAETLLRFGIGLCWLLVLAGAAGLLWSRARHRLLVQGG